MSTTLYAYQGKEFVENTIFLDYTGSPFNVTGHTSYLKVAKYYDGDASDTITIAGTIVAPATNGAFKYTAAKEVINGMKYGNYVYTRYLVDSLGAAVNVVSGDFTVVASVK